MCSSVAGGNPKHAAILIIAKAFVSIMGIEHTAAICSMKPFPELDLIG